ncbi:hypothetical protein H9Y04_45005 [Streptomyces sp. TRM66268-LWL]|uniref:DUF5134 domain-containing protein n=1 Tax=Streptomyces polyasparticus TaxID=2767826 RepID=A0ABR7SXX4_9ACTN|nr:hypothetical protein [Streptomyces polyasparticus]MBC9719649.1 hypothetical protein [Streptomyces polyasparticus]
MISMILAVLCALAVVCSWAEGHVRMSRPPAMPLAAAEDQARAGDRWPVWLLTSTLTLTGCTLVVLPERTLFALVLLIGVVAMAADRLDRMLRVALPGRDWPAVMGALVVTAAGAAAVGLM